MARKREEEKPASGNWINTFADLMNLLLCFFVLLFSMSTVDADKYEQLVTSMTESINIFDGGGNAVGEGAFVASGTDQIVAISNYFNEFEEEGKNDGEDSGKDDGKQDSSSTEQGAQDDGEKMSIDEYEAKKLAKQKEATEEVYNNVAEEARKKNIEDEITVNMDKSYQYVQISLNGAILFDSGQAELKKSTRSLLSKVAEILKLYNKNMIKIEGHTDNVPISGGQYKDNMRLSAARAMEVFDFLVKKGLEPESLEATGRGEYDKVVSNKTAAGRARNRRVELKIYTNK